MIWSWYTGHWRVGCYIWYSEEGTGRGRSPSSPLLAVPNVTANPSTASVPITELMCNGPLLYGFNVAIKGLQQYYLSVALCVHEGIVMCGVAVSLVGWWYTRTYSHSATIHPCDHMDVLWQNGCMCVLLYKINYLEALSLSHGDYSERKSPRR